ncbi:hypothetical protein P7L53_05500 [Thermoleptolyngbya sichuanensis XZ-Cy5]|uniref:hypothetical protein n=1 Tax=Thermoleptolyngbya sichuanensis TaxID=2885951 RepID=UPI00240E659D|nr:hypothetical protein [Thermoleptolyngbya sichuanensis]MDG2615696.1 hypothetical protein [Thermoleptolyngbya sichuanensis XZ-Cy5]
MTKPNASAKLAEVPKSPEEIQREKQRMYDVLFLLEQLFHREEATVKLVLGCLYDVGAVNLINQKLTFRPLNRLGKGTARLSKPLFTAIAIRWFHKNVPQLLTEWLHSKVQFEPEEPAKPVAEAAKAEMQETVTAANAELVQPAAVAPDQTALLSEGSAPLLQPISPSEPTYSPVALELQPRELQTNQTNQTNGKAAIAQSAQPITPMTQNGTLHLVADASPITRPVEHSTVVASVAPVAPVVAASSISLQESEMMPRTAALAVMEDYRQEIARLRSRVNYLAIALISVSGILTSALLWVATNPPGNTVEAETRPQPVLTQPAIGSGTAE